MVILAIHVTLFVFSWAACHKKLLYTNVCYIFQVTHFCDPGHTGVDCYDADERDMNALPLQCDDDFLDNSNISNFTCFHLNLNPVTAAAITGGFLKITPQLFFSTILYLYFKLLKITHPFQSVRKLNIAIHVVVAVVAEIGFVGAGLIVLIVASTVDSIREISLETANPLRQMTIIFAFIMYFIMSGFVWCVLPVTKDPVRFQGSKWKQNVFLAAQKATTIKKSSRMRPWVVVDRSLSTEDRRLLTDDDDS